MKAKAIEFIFKRLGTKLDDLGRYDDLDLVIDDIRVYIDYLKELLQDIAL